MNNMERAIENTSDRNPVEELAEDYLARRRRGESPSTSEYTRKYPQWTNEIEDLFPALDLMEEFKPNSDDLSHVEYPSSDDSQHTVNWAVGDYQIHRELGRGGMGVVYDAEQRSLGRRVALKVLPERLASNSKYVARFHSEARAAAQLHHTNIVPVFDIGQDSEHLYYAMQLIPGQSLDLVIAELKRIRVVEDPAFQNEPDSDGEPRERQLVPGAPTSLALAHSLMAGSPERPAIESNHFGSGDEGNDFGRGVTEGNGADSVAPSSPRLDPTVTETVALQVGSTVSAVLPGQSDVSSAARDRRAYFESVARVGLQAADALSYAHARGTVHRDIKPANLLLDARGVVWVTDFGLAKSNDHSLTHTGDILGTLRYMSPERFRGQCDHRADVYSLGLTLYEMLVLRPAFESPDQLNLIEMIGATEPAAPSSIDPRIPRDLETIVLKSIDKDLKRRYQSADELHDDLRRFIDDEPIKARPISNFERLLRWGRRNKGLAASVTCIAVLLVGAAAGFAALAAHREEQRREMTELRDRERRGRIEAEIGVAAAQALGALDETPERANLLALDAVKMARAHMSVPPKASEQSLLSIAHGTLLSTRAGIGGRPINTGHTKGLFVLEVSPDGRWLVTGSNDKTALVWDLTRQDPGSPATVPEFRLQHDAGVLRATFSPDGRWLVTCSKDTRIWDLESHDPEQAFTILPGNKSRTKTAAIDPSSRWLAMNGTGNAVWVFDLKSTTPVASMQTLDGHAGPVWDVAFSADGRWLASASEDQTARLWDLHSSTPWSESISLEGHTLRVAGVTFGPNSRWLVSSGENRYAMVWDLKAADLASSVVELHGHGEHINSVAISADGRWVATGSGDRTARLWDLAIENRTAEQMGKSSIVLHGHAGFVGRVVFCPGGRWLATGSADHTARLWDLKSERISDAYTVLRGHQDAVNLITATPDGRWLVTASYGNPRMWDLRSENPASPTTLRAGASRIRSMVLNRDGSRLVTGSHDGAARVWNVKSDDPAFSSTLLEGGSSPIVKILIGPADRWVAARDEDQVCRLWRLGSESKSPRFALEKVTSHAISPRGRRIATGHLDGSVRLWNLLAENPQEDPLLLERHGGRVTALAFTRDGTLVSASADGIARLWDLAADNRYEAIEQRRHPDPSRHNPGILRIALSPDGRVLVTAGNSWLGVWDLTGSVAPRNRGFLTVSGAEKSLAVQRTEQAGEYWIAVSQWGHSAELLKVPLADVGRSTRFTLPHGHSTHTASISHDGKRLVTGGDGSTAYLWNLASPNPAASPLSLRGHRGHILASTFTPDSRAVITAGGDTTARLWSLDLPSLMQETELVIGREPSEIERQLHQFYSAP